MCHVFGSTVPPFEDSGSGQNVVATFGDQNIPGHAIDGSAQGFPGNISKDTSWPLFPVSQVCMISGNQTRINRESSLVVLADY